MSSPDPNAPEPPFILGFEEWVALPDLGLPAIRAKVDTGARTSALHAFRIEPFGPAAAPMVRFAVHPVPGRETIEVVATAPLIDQRDVTSSNGERERRCVIAARMRIGARSWPVEITLTNRAAMSYRMLLGRQALTAGMLIDPTTSFRQPRLGYRVYGKMPARDLGRRALTIALIGRRLDQPTARLLARAIEARGHRLIPIDPARAELDPVADGLALRLDGVPMAPPDAIVAGAAAHLSGFEIAIWRHLESLGADTSASADALAVLSNRAATAQRLLAAGVPVDRAMLAKQAPRRPSHHASQPAPAVLVLAGDAFSRNIEGIPAEIRAAEDLSARAAAALGLGLARIDLAREGPAFRVLGVTACPALTGFGGRAAALAARLVALIEERCRRAVEDLPQNGT